MPQSYSHSSNDGIKWFGCCALTTGKTFWWILPLLIFWFNSSNFIPLEHYPRKGLYFFYWWRNYVFASFWVAWFWYADLVLVVSTAIGLPLNSTPFNFKSSSWTWSGVLIKARPRCLPVLFEITKLIRQVFGRYWVISKPNYSNKSFSVTFSWRLPIYNFLICLSSLNFCWDSFSLTNSSDHRRVWPHLGFIIINLLHTK